MQITVSNSGNFALILCKARSGAKRLRLVTCSSWKLPGAAHAPRAEELQPKQEKQSDLDIDNSSVSTASPTLRCHRCHRLSIGESYGHSVRPSDTNDVEQTRFWEGEGKKAWQASGKTNKDVNILLLKQALKQLPFCRLYGFVWLWIKDFFFFLLDLLLKWFLSDCCCQYKIDNAVKLARFQSIWRHEWRFLIFLSHLALVSLSCLSLPTFLMSAAKCFPLPSLPCLKGYIWERHLFIKLTKLYKLFAVE